MQDHTAYRFRATLHRLRRSPVLIAMMATLSIFSVTASIAGIAMWRAGSACVAPISVTETADGADLLSHKVASAACPCAAPIGWHWQRI